MAKGVKRAPRKGVKCGFDLLCRYDLVYAERRRSALHTLTERYLWESFREMRGALERVIHGYYAAELVLNLTAEGQPCPLLYELLLATARRIAGGGNLALSILLLEIGALREQGWLPVFDVCVVCGTRLGRRRSLLFSPDLGGAVCGRCRKALDEGVAQRATLAKSGDLMTLHSLVKHPPRRIERVTVPPDVVLNMSRLLRWQIAYLLGKKLAMWKHLQKLTLASSTPRA